MQAFREKQEREYNPNGITKDMDAIHIPTGLKVHVIAMLQPNHFGPGAAGCRFPKGAHISIAPKMLRPAA